MINEKLCLVYVTTKDRTQAEMIVSVLLEDKLIACANIIPHALSYFIWEGKIDTQDESIIIMKTRDSLYSTIRDRISKIHSYRTPSILKLPVEACSQGFLNWVNDETIPK